MCVDSMSASFPTDPILHPAWKCTQHTVRSERDSKRETHCNQPMRLQYSTSTHITYMCTYLKIDPESSWGEVRWSRKYRLLHSEARKGTSVAVCQGEKERNVALHRRIVSDPATECDDLPPPRLLSGDSTSQSLTLLTCQRLREMENHVYIYCIMYMLVEHKAKYTYRVW